MAAAKAATATVATAIAADASSRGEVGETGLFAAFPDEPRLIAQLGTPNLSTRHVAFFASQVAEKERAFAMAV